MLDGTVLALLPSGKWRGGMVLAGLQSVVLLGKVVLAGISAPAWLAKVALADRQAAVLSGRIGLAVQPTSSRQAEMRVAGLKGNPTKAMEATTEAESRQTDSFSDEPKNERQVEAQKIISDSIPFPSY